MPRFQTCTSFHGEFGARRKSAPVLEGMVCHNRMKIVDNRENPLPLSKLEIHYTLEQLVADMTKDRHLTWNSVQESAMMPKASLVDTLSTKCRRKRRNVEESTEYLRLA